MGNFQRKDGTNRYVHVHEVVKENTLIHHFSVTRDEKNEDTVKAICSAIEFLYREYFCKGWGPLLCSGTEAGNKVCLTSYRLMVPFLFERILYGLIW